MGGARRRFARLVAGSTVVGLATLMFGIAPASAGALGSTITYNDTTGDVTVTAAAGAVNDVIESGDGDAITITDPNGWNAPADPECVVDGDDVTCTPGGGDSPIADVVIDLGDGDDSYEFDAAGGVPTGSTITVNGEEGVDTLTGDDSNETLNGGPGADVIEGNNGNDVLNGDEFGVLTGGNDDVFGGPGADTVRGQGGNDELDGGGGNDSLDGGGSNDKMDGGTGSDTLVGSTGGDTALYDTRSAAVNVSLDGVANDGEAGEADNVGTDVENVNGGSAGDTLTGSSVANKLKGFGGADTITGGAGNDLLYGGDGGDDITGGTGNDKLYGNDNADTLRTNGDGVRDYSYCGNGTDSYRRDGGTVDIIDHCENNLAG
jgi:Ca2+-binding RTX toxin-like protein